MPSLTQAERDLYLDRCRRQLEVERAAAPVPVQDNKDRNRFAAWAIYDVYCPFQDAPRRQLWEGMKQGKVLDEMNILWDNVSWSGEELTFVTMFNGIMLNCSLLLENNENHLLLSTRLKDEPFKCKLDLHQLEMLIRSVVWPALL